MSEFFSLLKTFLMCATVLAVAMVVLLSLPQCKLRSVGLEMAKYAMAAGLVLLTVSPIDLIPSVVPLIGWADDIAYVLAAIGSIRSALGDRQTRLMFDEMELEEIRNRNKE